MTPAENDQRLDAVRRACAAYRVMLAVAVAASEELQRMGAEDLVESFRFRAEALRLSLSLAEREIAQLEGVS